MKVEVIDRPGLPVPNSLYGLCERKACKIELELLRVQELCESRGGRPRLPVPNSPVSYTHLTLPTRR